MSHAPEDASPRPPSDPLAGLNPVQRTAVLHRGRPMLLLAGAGSGKTGVVTHRIADLLRGGAPGRQILAVTFTNRAAGEMRTRVFELLGVETVPDLLMSTFHALGARMLRRHASYFGRRPDFVVYDDDDQVQVLKQVATDANIELSAMEIKAVRRGIDRAKNAGETAKEMVVDEGLPLSVDWADFGARYERRLERANAFDFGDLVMRPAQLLSEVPELAADYRARWKYVHVDEFQDTNVAQYRLLAQLAPPGSELFAVGDDDQSIYGWRGAEVDNILKFQELYPTAEVVRLEQNYRSNGRILDAANQVIAHNQSRLGKTLWTEREPGPRLELYAGRDGRTEARWIAGRIAEMCGGTYGGGNFTAGEVAILFRANHLSLDLEQALQQVGTPYVLVKGRSFYDRAEVRDALAWIRLMMNPDDDVALLRAVGAPSRGVGKTSLERLAAVASRLNLPLLNAIEPALAGGAVKGKARTGLQEIHAALAAGGDEAAAPVERVRGVLEASGLLASLSAEAKAGEDERARLENVERLLDAIVQHTEEAPDPSLAAWLEQVKLVSELDVANLDGGRVSLMTVHAAKGLEFPVVFVMGMEEGLFPHHNATREFNPERRQKAVEEERRLCYVAITRARQRLFLTRAGERMSRGEFKASEPSRFLRELPEDAITGARVAADPYAEADRSGWSRATGAPRGGPNAGRAWGAAGRASDPTVRREHGPSVDDLCIDEPPRRVVLDGPPPSSARVVQPMGGGGEVFAVGQHVYHGQFGVGVVQAWRPGRDPKVSVRFAGVGVLDILARFVSAYGE